MTKEKGFIFTLDALFAIAVVMLIANAYLLSAEKADPESSEKLSRLARDKAIVNSYLGKAAEQINDLKFVECKTTFSYEADNGNANGGLTKNKVCLSE